MAAGTSGAVPAADAAPAQAPACPSETSSSHQTLESFVADAEEAVRQVRESQEVLLAQITKASAALSAVCERPVPPSLRPFARDVSTTHRKINNMKAVVARIDQRLVTIEAICGEAQGADTADGD